CSFGEDLDHVAAHIANLVGCERAAERRHVVAAFGHCSNRGCKIAEAGERRTGAVPAFAVVAMTDHTRLFINFLSAADARRVHCSDWWRWRGCLPRDWPDRFSGRQLPIETEQPNTVSARGADESTAGRECEHVLFTVVLERAGRCVHARASLEFPELLPCRRVESGEPPIVAADKKQASARCQYPAVALFGPLIAPRESVRGHIKRCDDASAGDACVGGGTSEKATAGRRSFKRSISAAGVSADYG